MLSLRDRRKQKKEVDVEAALKNITGVIRDEGLSLEDYRNERLEKYAGIDGYECGFGRFDAAPHGLLHQKRF